MSAVVIQIKKMGVVNCPSKIHNTHRVIIMNLLCFYNKIAGINIFLDQYFTRVTVTNWCKEKRFSIVGTMRKYKKEISTNIKALENRKEKSTKFCSSEDNKMLLTSYFDKKA